MRMAAVLFIGAEAFEQIVNIPSIERLLWNLTKIDQAVSEKMFQDFTISYMCLALGLGQINPKLSSFTTLIMHCKNKGKRKV